MIIKAVLNILMFAFVWLGLFLAYSMVVYILNGRDLDDIGRGGAVLMLLASFLSAFFLIIAFYKWG